MEMTKCSITKIKKTLFLDYFCSENWGKTRTGPMSMQVYALNILADIKSIQTKNKLTKHKLKTDAKEITASLHLH